MNIPRDAEILEIGAEEHRVLGCEDYVHGGCDNPASEDTIALDGGYSRFLHVSPAQGLVNELLTRVVVAATHPFLDLIFRGPILGLLRRAEVVPGGKMIASASQHDNAHFRVKIGSLEGMIHLDQHRSALCVTIARPVSSDARNTVHDLVGDILVVHNSFLFRDRVIDTRHSGCPQTVMVRFLHPQ